MNFKLKNGVNFRLHYSIFHINHYLKFLNSFKNYKKDPMESKIQKVENYSFPNFHIYQKSIRRAEELLKEKKFYEYEQRFKMFALRKLKLKKFEQSIYIYLSAA